LLVELGYDAVVASISFIHLSFMFSKHFLDSFGVFLSHLFHHGIKSSDSSSVNTLHSDFIIIPFFFVYRMNLVNLGKLSTMGL